MTDHIELKDHFTEARIFMARAIVAMVAVFVLVSILVARFYSLQVVNHGDYVTQSERNRVHIQPVPPTRGLIFDRNGKLLADNKASYTLSIVKERVGNMEQTLNLLKSLVDISEADLSNFHKQLSQWRRPYQATPLRYRLSEKEIARIAVNEYRLDGVEVEAQLVRHYPLGELVAHSVGYVARISEQELTAFSSSQYQRYSGTHSIGKIGLEKEYENVLLGEVGFQNVETNARGRVLRVLERTDPIPGVNITLYLDSVLQKVAFDAMAGRRGSVVALEIATGGVLAMVSTPSYDSNLFVTGISYKDYGALRGSLDKPMFNRSIQGQYPPGSTLKPMLGLAGLSNKVVDPQYRVPDPGFYQLVGDERLYRDWKKKGHGKFVNLRQAIIESCDTYFYDLAFRMGIDKIHAYGKQFGLGQRVDLDLPNESAGLWPSRQWKRAARGLPWFPGDSLNVGLGQGDVLTTPLQLAYMTSILASRGKRRLPRMVQMAGNEVATPSSLGEVVASDQHWDFILDTMKGVVHTNRGTAVKIRSGAKFPMAGKTGTVQLVGIAQDSEYDSEALAERQRDHALFVGFAPADDPKIAVAVIVENGEKSSSAALVARAVFEAHLLPRTDLLSGAHFLPRKGP